MLYKIISKQELKYMTDGRNKVLSLCNQPFAFQEINLVDNQLELHHVDRGEDIGVLLIMIRVANTRFNVQCADTMYRYYKTRWR